MMQHDQPPYQPPCRLNFMFRIWNPRFSVAVRGSAIYSLSYFGGSFFIFL